MMTDPNLQEFDYENRFVHNETYLQITGSARKMKKDIPMPEIPAI